MQQQQQQQLVHTQNAKTVKTGITASYTFHTTFCDITNLEFVSSVPRVVWHGIGGACVSAHLKQTLYKYKINIRVFFARHAIFKRHKLQLSNIGCFSTAGGRLCFSFDFVGIFCCA